MMPLLMTTVMTLVAPQDRGKMMGKISVVMSLAPAAGPVVSGIILSYLHAWQFLFILVLPIALLALFLGWQRMVNVTTPHKASLDIVSVIISAFAFGGIVYGSQRPRHGRCQGGPDHDVDCARRSGSSPW